ncbi:iron dicitrate transport regulator FecR [Noviherbaspirillum denitrificans]|uniref:Iron dicitrate transport regulator FecR n=2 Tax=Noviherbaspirillum denitrificans TaxID=1968433 RepID=A0A254T7Z7_9BURK|nr:iron dicitrate transport regulator FecR [Noviherbaspirillum denitrificans]
MAALLLATQSWAAQVVGTVANLSGPLVAKKADGTAKVLAVKSSVEQGDILVAEKDTYARIKFIDDSEITLRPNTQLKIENFSFEADKPEKDSAAFDLVKGGLRAVTGTLGKRNKEKWGMNTPTATIGIRGTTFIAEYVAPDDAAVAAYGMASMAAMTPSGYTDVRSDMPAAVPLQVLPLRVAQVPGQPGGGGLAPGLYVQVIDGLINLSNRGGSLNFSAGQFGYTATLVQPPVVLPNNPGIKFSPPPTFNVNTGSQGGAGSSSGGSAVDCEVR